MTPLVQIEYILAAFLLLTVCGAFRSSSSPCRGGRPVSSDPSLFPSSSRTRSAYITQMVASLPPKTSGSGSIFTNWFPPSSADDFVIPPEYKRGKDLTEVTIESPSLNSRRISATMLIDTNLDDVWSILTDYDRLSVHVPNLVKSNLLPSPNGGIRLFQEGAQRIVGFTFRASLTMDMEEDNDEARALKERNLSFKLVESQMFSSFDGTWKIRTHSRTREIDPLTGQYATRYKTLLSYSVYVRPRGPVPVAALEWRIREDIPINLMAVKIAAEKRSAIAMALTGAPRGVGGVGVGQGLGGGGASFGGARVPRSRSRTSGSGINYTGDGDEGISDSDYVPYPSRAAGWGADETLAAYFPTGPRGGGGGAGSSKGTMGQKK